MTHRYRTNLRCESCVATIKSLLDQKPGIRSWSADVISPDKVLTVEADHLSIDRLNALLGKAGYQVLGELADTPATSSPESEPKTSYFPLILILLYLLLVVGGV